MIFFLVCFTAVGIIVFGGKSLYRNKQTGILLMIGIVILAATAVMIVGTMLISKEKYAVDSDTTIVELQKTAGPNSELGYLQIVTEGNESEYQFLGAKTSDSKSVSALETIKVTKAEVVVDGSKPRLVSVSTHYKAWWFAPYSTRGFEDTYTFYLTTSDQLLTTPTTK